MKRQKVLAMGLLSMGVLLTFSFLFVGTIPAAAPSEPLPPSFHPSSSSGSSSLRVGGGLNSTQGLDASDAQAVRVAQGFYSALQEKHFSLLTHYLSPEIKDPDKVVALYRNLYHRDDVTLLSYNVYTIQETGSTPTKKLLLVDLDERVQGKDYKYTSELVEQRENLHSPWGITGEHPYNNTQ